MLAVRGYREECSFCLEGARSTGSGSRLGIRPMQQCDGRGIGPCTRASFGIAFDRRGEVVGEPYASSCNLGGTWSRSTSICPSCFTRQMPESSMSNQMLTRSPMEPTIISGLSKSL